MVSPVRRASARRRQCAFHGRSRRLGTSARHGWAYLNPRTLETLCYRGFYLLRPERKGQPYALIERAIQGRIERHPGGTEVVLYP